MTSHNRTLELTERGDIMAATVLARDVYKIRLTEARQFVQTLQTK